MANDERAGRQPLSLFGSDAVLADQGRAHPAPGRTCNVSFQVVPDVEHFARPAVRNRRDQGVEIRVGLPQAHARRHQHGPEQPVNPGRLQRGPAVLSPLGVAGEDQHKTPRGKCAQRCDTRRVNLPATVQQRRRAGVDGPAVM